jgi:hypothetical protein
MSLPGLMLGVKVEILVDLRTRLIGSAHFAASAFHFAAFACRDCNQTLWESEVSTRQILLQLYYSKDVVKFSSKVQLDR